VTGSNNVRAGVHPRLAARLLLPLLALSCSGEPRHDLPVLTLGRGVEVHAATGTTQRVPDLYAATALAAAGPDVLIMDGGNNRVLRLDGGLRLLASFGAAGAGPGEFGYAPDMAVRGDTVAVADLANGRIMLFDVRLGAEIRTRAAAGVPRNLAWLEDGSFLMPAASADHYLVRVDTAGNVTPFGRRPAGHAPLQTGATAIVAGCGTAVHVLDDDHGTLLRYSAEGELVDAHQLPAAMRRALMQRRNQTVRTFQRRGYRVVGLPLVKQLAPLGCDGLLILFTHDSHFGVRVDFATGSAHPMLLPQDEKSSRPLREATAILPRPSDLIVLSNDEVFTYAYR
jgi:hypothetical protein